MDYEKAIQRVETEKEFVQNYLDELASKIILSKDAFTRFKRIEKTSIGWEQKLASMRIKRIERMLNSLLIQQAHAINELEELTRIGTLWLTSFHKESAL